MTDASLEDLAASAGIETADGDDGGSADDGGSGGEWIDRLFDRLDERGYLDLFIQQQLDIEGDAGVEAGDAAGDAAADVADEIGADEIARFGKLVLDNVGDVPVSEVVKFAESNPGTVDGLVRQALGGEDG